MVTARDEIAVVFQQVKSSCHGTTVDATACAQSKAALEAARVGLKEKIKACMGQVPNPVPNPNPPAPTPKPPTSTPKPIPTPIPTPVAVNPPSVVAGAVIYMQNCASCHGTLASSDIKGRSASRIQSAIGSVSAMKRNSAIMALTPAQISAIAVAVGGTP
jgi:hypothetical protein